MKKLFVTAMFGMALASIPVFACTGNQKQEVQQTQADKDGYIVRVGQEAPDFTILYTDGSKKKLSELRGKVVMLQFTASWCGVCRQEMPFIEKDIWQKHKENPDFVLLGIDRDEPVETVEKFPQIHQSYLSADIGSRCRHLWLVCLETEWHHPKCADRQGRQDCNADPPVQRRGVRTVGAEDRQPVAVGAFSVS